MSNITKYDRELFEEYLKKHPVEVDTSPEVFDDQRFQFDYEQSGARLVKLLLDGNIK